jgi:hypothetical protein
VNDPWKYVAFPVASVVSYLISEAVTAQQSTLASLTQFQTEIAVIAVSGFLAGFMVDEVIPAYVEKVRNSDEGSGGPGFGDGGDLDDLDLG